MADAVTLTRYDITDLNNGAIAEFPVADPPGWDAISLYYAKALQKMGWNESGQGDAPPAPENPDNDPVRGTPNVENTWHFGDKPDSYYFWGAMHCGPDTSGSTGIPPPHRRGTNTGRTARTATRRSRSTSCLGRAYIYFYEVIVRAKVAELGGPATWALPYWDYSHHDPSNPSTPWPRARLPWVFCQPKLPDGSGNPLHLDRRRRGLQPMWPDGQPMFLRPGTPYYAAAYGQSSWGPTDPNEGFNSALDGRPHGLVHVDTGNGDGLVSATGWMQNTQTAGFDPIFWLHHSEFDRFWVGWNAAAGQNPNQQTDPDWLTAADDEVNGEPVVGHWNFWSDGDIGNVVVVHPGEMLDPASLDSGKFPYSYEYQDLPPVPAPRQGGRAMVADRGAGVGGGGGASRRRSDVGPTRDRVK